MSSLLELLRQVGQIPEEEFRSGRRIGERPTEMGILGQIISPDQVLSIRQKDGLGIKRCCEPMSSITFRVTNGSIHKVVASLEGDAVRVTDNKKVVFHIDTVEDLRGYILRLVGVEQ